MKNIVCEEFFFVEQKKILLRDLVYLKFKLQTNGKNVCSRDKQNRE